MQYAPKYCFCSSRLGLSQVRWVESAGVFRGGRSTCFDCVQHREYRKHRLHSGLVTLMGEGGGGWGRWVDRWTLGRTLGQTLWRMTTRWEREKKGLCNQDYKTVSLRGPFFSACFFLFFLTATTASFGSDQPLHLHNNIHTHTSTHTSRLRIPEIHPQPVNHWRYWRAEF